MSVGRTARRRLHSRRHLPTLTYHPHALAQVSATERSPSLVREPGTAHLLVFVFPRHHTISDYCKALFATLPAGQMTSISSSSSSSARAAATRSSSRYICHALAQLSTTDHLQVVPWFGTGLLDPSLCARCNGPWSSSAAIIG